MTIHDRAFDGRLDDDGAPSDSRCTSRSAGNPYFKDVMTVADVYHYPTQHYEHHRRQLTTRRALDT